MLQQRKIQLNSKMRLLLLCRELSKYSHTNIVHLKRGQICWLIRRKAQIRILGQTSKRNLKEKYSFGDFPVSRLLAKTLRVNKHAIKKFLKNLLFVVDFKL